MLSERAGMEGLRPLHAQFFEVDAGTAIGASTPSLPPGRLFRIYS